MISKEVARKKIKINQQQRNYSINNKEITPSTTHEIIIKEI